ncbi:hypothetical protein BTT_64400 (plasmid) [Bacillus thuringiensis serovar morrisoni str. 4AA1]|uniref:hypothetical protein n=1 Tax=Bacillus TaxID=1386 RepID=UPI0005CF802C|nr:MULTISPECIES: hypothetical protein [Bacillus]AJQ62756.1 hypothetical protein SD98_31425 [Bacillus thuringiensis serovar morrisoni]MED3102236.1 hypothetical protein [Bacillus thuringiensis]MRA99425.1 hypothetical protein [Bacillus thuringiensis]OTY44114.1 hypothetical protein BK736_05465 [Bacillus thuringiensis serovar poloniensis]RNG22417.1 hypothetical protein EEL55_29520 [Bacillus thuringiensis]
MKNDNYEEIGEDYTLIEVCRLATKEEREKEFRKELFTKIFLAPVIIMVKIVNLILMLLKNKIKNRSLKRLYPSKKEF